jgi:hypothetical protein
VVKVALHKIFKPSQLPLSPQNFYCPQNPIEESGVSFWQGCMNRKKGVWYLFIPYYKDAATQSS